jgi:hypothetical protein
MTTIRVWCGYRTDHTSEILFVVFDGERLDALSYAPGGRAVEWTFYRTNDGRAVVQEVCFGAEYDFGVVYVFSSIVEACARFASEFARVGADLTRVDADLARVPVCAEPSDAPTVTLDEYLKAAREK